MAHSHKVGTHWLRLSLECVEWQPSRGAFPPTPFPIPSVTATFIYSFKSIFHRVSFCIYQENNVSLRQTTTWWFMLEAEFTACWPSAQILKCPLLFCSLHYHKSNILLAEEFQTCNVRLAFYGCIMCAKCKFFFASFSLQTNETHPGCNTSPSSFQKNSGILFDTVFFLGIRPASQTCSPSSTLSLSKTFYNNFHRVTA